MLCLAVECVYLSFLVAFSTLVLKLSFSQSLSVHSHLYLHRVDLLMTTRYVAVTGGGSIGKCGRPSQPSVYYNIVILTSRAVRARTGHTHTDTDETERITNPTLAW